MALLTLDLQPELYQRLQVEAVEKGKQPENLVIEWIWKRLSPKPADSRTRAQDVLRSAGLLAEPSDAMKKLAAQGTMSLSQVQAALDRSSGKPLSEIILEQRGPKI